MIWAAVVLLVVELLGYAACFSALPRPPAPWAWVLIAPGLAVGVAGTVQNLRRKTAALFAALTVVSLGWAAFAWVTPRAARLAQSLDAGGIYHAKPEVFVKSAAMLVLLLTLLAAIAALWLAASAAKGKAGKEPPGAVQPPWAIYSRKRFSRDPYAQLDVVLCTDKESKRPVLLYGKDRFLNTLVLGPIGTGKTSRVFLPLVYQDLMKMAEGVKMGITVIEPNGALVEQVAKICFILGIPYTVLDPYDPASARFNPLLGPPDVAAETMRSVLRSIFGKQEEFFALVQETAAKNVILLLRELKGEDLDIVEALRVLRDPETLSNYVSQLENVKGREDDLAQYFRRELLGVLRDKYYQFAAGLRQQLEDLASNQHLRAVLTGKDSINLDAHLEDGGVLLVNTRMGPLGRLGDIFGRFVLMHFQNAVFRRPGNEFTRLPHFLYVDELPRYVNPDLERFFAIGRQYRCGLVVAMQSLAQMELAAGKGFDEVVMGQCRNKVIYGGLAQSDALKFQRQFGELLATRWDESYDASLGMPGVFPERLRRTDAYQPLWHYTDIIYLDAYTFIYQIVRDGQVLKPGWGYNELVNIDKIRPPVRRDARPAAPARLRPAPAPSPVRAIEPALSEKDPGIPGENEAAAAAAAEQQPVSSTAALALKDEAPTAPAASPARASHAEEPAASVFEAQPETGESQRPSPLPESFIQQDDGFWTFD